MNKKLDLNQSDAPIDEHGEPVDEPTGPTQDEPVMDGATDEFDPAQNPRKGMSDPRLNRNPETGKKTTNPYG